jgi:hypothetical protein
MVILNNVEPKKIKVTADKKADRGNPTKREIIKTTH